MGVGKHDKGKKQPDNLGDPAPPKPIIPEAANMPVPVTNTEMYLAEILCQINNLRQDLQDKSKVESEPGVVRVRE